VITAAPIAALGFRIITPDAAIHSPYRRSLVAGGLAYFRAPKVRAWLFTQPPKFCRDTSGLGASKSTLKSSHRKE
jgi:hypothetical protein